MNIQEWVVVGIVAAPLLGTALFMGVSQLRAQDRYMRGAIIHHLESVRSFFAASAVSASYPNKRVFLLRARQRLRHWRRDAHFTHISICENRAPRLKRSIRRRLRTLATKPSRTRLQSPVRAHVWDVK
jgi:hypothetical protein